MPSQRFGGAAAITEDADTERTNERRLRVLFHAARALSQALRSGADEDVLKERIRAYVRCAASQGISSSSIRVALEFLVLEHVSSERLPECEHVAAGRERPNPQVLALVLRLAELSDPHAPPHGDLARELARTDVLRQS